MEQQLLDALNWRYAVQKFDTTKKLTDQQVNSLLNVTRLAPSSFGIEPWHFIAVSNPELLLKLQEAAYGQQKVAQASHLIVIAQKTNVHAAIDEHIETMVAATGAPASAFDGYKGMVGGAAGGRTDEANAVWTAKQTYIALGFLLESAALMGIDAGPMEGFDPATFDQILGLEEKGLHAVTSVSIGYRDETDEAAARPKARQSLEQVVTHLK
jgi:nitroreductase / dihydropteridine reductase